MARVGETEYGGKGGMIQREVDGHRLDADRKGNDESAMMLRKQGLLEANGIRHRVEAADGTVTWEPYTEEDVRAGYEKL